MKTGVRRWFEVELLDWKAKCSGEKGKAKYAAKAKEGQKQLDVQVSSASEVEVESEWNERKKVM